MQLAAPCILIEPEMAAPRIQSEELYPEDSRNITFGPNIDTTHVEHDKYKHAMLVTSKRARKEGRDTDCQDV